MIKTFAQVQSGTGQIRFVTGQAGSGKTALVGHFVQRTFVSDPEAVFAMGTCNAQTGIGDPYLPFRETIATLIGDSTAQQAANKIAPENTNRFEVRESQQFVNELIDSEPNRLADTFRQALFHQTSGHALFTVELLRTIQQSGNLIRELLEALAH